MAKSIVSIWNEVIDLTNYGYNWKWSLRDFDICIFWTRWIDTHCQITHRQQEIRDFLQTWKNIFVVVNGSWNRFDSLLPNFQICDFKDSEGKKIKTIDKNLEISANIFWGYTWYFNNISEHFYNILYTTNDGKTLWFWKETWWWKVIVIPYISISWFNFSHTRKLNNEFIKTIVDFDKYLSLNHDNEQPIPKWIIQDDNLKTKYLLSTENNLRNSYEEIDKQNKLIETYKKDIQEESKMFGLLYWTWDSLEYAVTKWLELLWYNVSDYDDWILELDQVIESPDWKRYIWECKWKEWNVDIKDLRQLFESTQRDYERDEITEKAIWILFWNTERLKPLEERWSEAFTTKVLTSAKASNIILVKTPDLFFAVKYIIDNPDDEEFKEKCREAIETSQWKIVEFPKPTE